MVAASSGFRMETPSTVEAKKIGRAYHNSQMSGDPAQSQEITVWLAQWRAGDGAAGDRLLDRVYPELRQIANRFLRSERQNHTLEPNALVNELWLRLVGGAPVSYESRIHFFAIAAQTMRRILIDHARARVADKRGGDQQQVTLSAVEGWNPVAQNEDMLALDQALSRLEKADPRAARVVELRFFGGLQEDEIATLLDVSIITVKRDWKVARAWLMGRLQVRDS
jgi:RNA polymerase sigma-70 factor, ECF subfamily